MHFLQNENASLKKEIGSLKSKLQSEEERHGQAAKTWQETEVALKSQLDQLTEREAQAKKSLDEMTNSTEGLKEQLKLIQVKKNGPTIQYTDPNASTSWILRIKSTVILNVIDF